MRKFDYTKLQDMQWDREILRLVAAIHESKGRQDAWLHQYPVHLHRVMENARLQSIEFSNAIEGIYTAKYRLQPLIAGKLAPENPEEGAILGYRDVLDTIDESYPYIPITSNAILQLHRDLFKSTGTDMGGHFKNVQNYISAVTSAGESFVLFQPLSPFETSQAMYDICENYNQAIQTEVVDPLILIPIFIHDFLCIHPFNDGNGRMSRLLTTLALYQNGYFVGKYISLEKIVADHKAAYYETLESCQHGWQDNQEDVLPFIKYMLQVILLAYKKFEDRVSMVEKKQSA